MLGWILLLYFIVSTIAGEGLVAALTALGGAVGVDVVAAVVIGGSISDLILGAGLADDVLFLAFGSELTFIEKVALTVFLDEAKHVSKETFEHYDHTDQENEQWSRYLQRRDPGAIYLFGDVTPRDLFDLGVSAGILVQRDTLGTLLDAAKDKYGGLVEKTTDLIAIGGV